MAGFKLGLVCYCFIIILMTKDYDIGIGWANPVDQKFVEAIKLTAKKKGVSVKEIKFPDLRSSFDLAKQDKLRFKLFIDRSSDDHPTYFLLAQILKEKGIQVLNDPNSIINYSSKAYLHRILEQNNFPVPKTFILSPRSYPKNYLAKVAVNLGRPFVLKPSHGGGGEGVITSARSGKDIANFLKDNHTDECLAQQYVTAPVMMGKTAWFRPIYVCGLTIPLWWNPGNSFYHQFDNSTKENIISKKLKKYMEKIAKLTGLELFSAEFTIDENGRFVIIDYANHPIDLSTHEAEPDGLPPDVVKKIALQIVNSINKY